MEEWNNQMYHFRDTIAFSEYESWIPSSAMIYDNCLFEQEIEGYQTLYVEGREMLSVKLETANAQTGTIITNQSLPAREITVHYKLVGRTAAEVQTKFKQLMLALYRTEDVPIYFKDELEILYYGRYTEADKVPGDTNSITSSFTIYCADPRKFYGRSLVIETPNTPMIDLPFETFAEKIEVTLTQSNSIKISNGFEKITITGAAIKPNDKIIFDIKKGKVLVNGQNKTHYLDLASDFKSFRIRSNREITCNNGTAKIFYRKVMY